MATTTFWRPFTRGNAARRDSAAGAPSDGAQAGVAPGLHVGPIVKGVVGLSAIGAALALAMTFRTAPVEALGRYQTETVSRGALSGVLRVPATIESKTTVRIGSPVTGRVAAVLVAPGDRVKRGQVLARLEDEELRAEAVGADAQSVAAQAGAREAQLKLGRLMHVLEQVDKMGDVPPSAMPALAELEQQAISAETEFVQALAQVKQRESAARAARVSLKRAVLRAPIDGIVVSRAVEAGEVVSPLSAAQPLFVIASEPSEMKMVASVEERDASRIRGTGARFSVPAFPGRTFDAAVAGVAFAPADATTPPYRVMLHVPNHAMALRPGMAVTLNLPAESEPDALRVPLSAVTFAPPDSRAPMVGPGIWVMGQGEKPQRVSVQLGVSDGKQVEVRGAQLAAGTRVVVGVTDR